MHISFKWIGGATFIIWVGDVKMVVDPMLCPKGTVHDYFWFKSTRLEEPHFEAKDFEDIDLCLYTHAHKDHIDMWGMEQVKKSRPHFICDKGSSQILRPHFKNNYPIEVLTWGRETRISIKGWALTIRATSTVHGLNPLSARLAGKGNGYLVTCSRANQSFTLYVTGDTIYKKKLFSSLAHHPIDLMVANMGAAMKGTWIMTLTLDAGMLQKLIGQLRPKQVIPVHFGTFSHYHEPVEAIRQLRDARIQILSLGTTTSWQT